MGNATPDAQTTLFLSYASEDRRAALGIATVLREAGFAVWFDQDELKGGDAWDLAIRERIRTCTFFVPLISAATEARAEGYFRREWKLAIERSHDMADDRPFIVPLVVDAFAEGPVRVPERFREFQWHNLAGGVPLTTVAERLRRLEARLAAPPRAERPARTREPWQEPVRRRPRWLIPGAALALVLAGAGVAWLGKRPPAAAAATDTAAVDQRSVAVLPFVDLNGDPANDYFSDGLTEELMTTLARETTWRVMARTSCYAFKGRKLSAQQIGAELRVATLVEGTVRRIGDRVRVTVQLVNAADGLRLWSDLFDQKLTDIFDVQSALAKAITARLEPTAKPAVASARPPTSNFDAFDAFLRGRSFQLKPPTRENIQQAIRFFQQATSLDPNYAIAWAHYGEALTRLHNAGHDDREETLVRAREAIGAALNLEPNLPQGHRALAGYLTVNWTNRAEAEKELVLAEKGLPNDPDILADLAVNNMERGNRDQAVAYIRRAVAVDGQNGDIADLAALIYDYASLYAEATAERERAFKLGGEMSSIIEKAVTYRNWKGDLDLVLKTLEAARPGDPNDKEAAGFFWRVKSAFLLARGDFKEALAAIDQMPVELVPTQFFYNSRSFLQARIREAMGDAAGARAAYERALLDAERYRAESPRKLRAHTLLALIYVGLNRPDDAWAAAQQCVQLAPPSDNLYVASRASLRILAQVAARTGRTEQALEIVRAQIAAGYWKRHDLLLDNDWRHLRQEPRFLELARAAPL